MALDRLIGIGGPSSDVSHVPIQCPECGGKDFYKQSDFRRSLGLFLVGLASFITVVMAAMGFNWFVIWSPMVAFLVFDRAMYYLRPPVLICYRCHHNFRGLRPEQLNGIENFDLELHDRILYKHEHPGEKPGE